MGGGNPLGLGGGAGEALLGIPQRQRRFFLLGRQEWLGDATDIHDAAEQLEGAACSGKIHNHTPF